MHEIYVGPSLFMIDKELYLRTIKDYSHSHQSRNCFDFYYIIWYCRSLSNSKLLLTLLNNYDIIAYCLQQELEMANKSNLYCFGLDLLKIKDLEH